MNKKLLSILVCPICRGSLEHDSRNKVLICREHEIAYPIRKGIPVLLESDAKKIEREML